MTDASPNADGSIDLETIVRVLADDHVIGQPNEYAPTDGRVLESNTDGTVYVGDGSSWLTVTDESGVVSRLVTATAETSDPATPSDGATVFYRGDLATPELRAIDENGTVATLATF